MTSSPERRDGASSPLPARLDPRAGRPPRSARAPGRGTSGPGGNDPRAGSRTGRLTAATRAIAAVLSLALLGVGGWGWYLGRVADASVTRTDAIPTSGNDGIGGQGEAMNLLLVGNDSRASATDEQLESLNTEASNGINTDTMILAHVPADGSRASFVSFPRDSYVRIPGYGWDKLNAAYAYGYTQEAPEGATEAEKEAAGAQLLIRTISQLTGLQVDHYAEVDLLGFFNLSSVVGGVEVNLCEPVQDDFSGVDLPAGVQTISGEQALAFVRQRHGLPRGDFDRIVRQQTFIAGMIRKMLSENVLLDLGKQRELVEAAADSLTVDQSLDLFELAGQMQTVTAGNVEFQTVPNLGTDQADGMSIVRLEDTEALHDFFAELSAEPGEQAPATTEAPASVDPGTVTVDVYNGSGISGLAGDAADELTAAGFAVGTTGNASSMDHEVTEIRYAAGDEALANTLAATIPGAVVQESDDPASGTVQLVLGSDFNGVGVAVTPAPPAPEVAGEDPRTAADTTCIN